MLSWRFPTLNGQNSSKAKNPTHSELSCFRIEFHLCRQRSEPTRKSYQDAKWWLQNPMRQKLCVFAIYGILVWFHYELGPMLNIIWIIFMFFSMVFSLDEISQLLLCFLEYIYVVVRCGVILFVLTVCIVCLCVESLTVCWTWIDEWQINTMWVELLIIECAR